ncbi:MAG: arylesterase [Halofilum sp. (in: g-proteobacteria)]|nr:arylesterase [Halofilum sp. (in: g-proteobacteria)]
MRVLLLVVLIALAQPAAAAGPTILVVGDSISAGYGIAVEEGWVARLRARLDAQGYPHAVVNASVSGDTTSGGRARLPAALERHEPAVVVIELGGNDGLRGLPLDAMRVNLAAMVTDARDAGARVLLLGVRLPPNYGPAYTERFTEVFRTVARRHDVALVPRVLAGVGERAGLMQADGIHPNAAGHARILETVWPKLQPLLERP